MTEGRARVLSNVTNPGGVGFSKIEELVLVDDESQNSQDGTPIIRSPPTRNMTMLVTGKKKKKVLLWSHISLWKAIF